MARVFEQPAYVLHSRPYRDTSLIVELLTRDYGRVGAMARGARRRRRGGQVLQPFRVLAVGWSGRGEMVTLGATEELTPVPMLQGLSLACGFYVNELVMRLVERGEPIPELFHSYSEAVHGLLKGEVPAPLLRLFEKRLLDYSGYGLALDREAGSGQPVREDGLYRYELESGAVPVTDAQRGIQGRTLLALAEERIPDKRVLQEARWLLAPVLEAHLGPRPLKSRELLAPYLGGDRAG
mgnify:CR=1 FL=1